MKWLCVLLVLNGSAVYSQRPVQKLRNAREEKREDNSAGQFLMARRQFKQGKLDEAKKILRRNLEDHPGHVPSLLLYARIAMQLGENDDAQKFLTRASAGGKSRSLNLLSAELAFRQNKPLKAMQLLHQSSQLSPSGDSDEVAGTDQMADLKRQSMSRIHSEKRAQPKFYTESASQPSADFSSVPKVDPQKKLRIAVFAFEVKASADTTLGSGIGDMMNTAMVQTNCFQVVERQHLDAVLKEQDFQMSDAVDQETAVAAGELMGIDAIVIGSAKMQSSAAELDSRVVSVQSGQVLSAASTRSESDKQLRGAVNQLTIELAKATYK